MAQPRPIKVTPGAGDLWWQMQSGQMLAAAQTAATIIKAAVRK